MALLETYEEDITPDVADVWIKNVGRPFLNRTVTVVDFSGVVRGNRGAVIPVLGRRLPVAITEVRGAREYTLEVRAADEAEREALDLFLSFGDTVYVQTPAGCTLPGSGHWLVGDVTEARVGRHDGPVRRLVLPLTECDAPDSSVVGYTITYLGVLNGWATYGDLLADPDVPTYLDLLEYVSAPEDEVVG